MIKILQIAKILLFERCGGKGLLSLLSVKQIAKGYILKGLSWLSSISLVQAFFSHFVLWDNPIKIRKFIMYLSAQILSILKPFKQNMWWNKPCSPMW